MRIDLALNLQNWLLLIRLEVIFLAVVHRNILWLLDIIVTAKLSQLIHIIYIRNPVVLNGLVNLILGVHCHILWLEVSCIALGILIKLAIVRF